MENNWQFGGLDAYSDLHLITNDINKPIAPATAEIIQDVPNMVGQINRGNNMTNRQFSINVTLIADTAQQRNEYTHIIADALYTPTDGDSEFIQDDEPNVTYYGHFTGDSALTRLSTNGTATLTFSMNDPYAYLPQVDIDVDQAVETFEVQGTQPTFPIISLIANQDIPYVGVTSPHKYIYIGQNVDAATGDTAFDPEPVILKDAMNDLSTWTNLTDETKTFVTYDGNVAGSWTNNANTMYCSDYGVGSKWHGACAERLLSQSLDNWRVRMRINQASGKPAQQGKMSIFLLGENKQKIGLLELKDSDQFNDVRVHADIGTDTTNHTIYDGSGVTQNVYSHQVLQYRKVAHTSKVKHTRTKRKKVKGKWETVKEPYYTTSTYYTNDPYYTTEYNDVATGGNLVSSYSEFNNFWGYLEMEKKGNVFTVYVIRLDESFNETHRDTYTFVDSNNQFTNKLAGIAVWSAAYGTADPCKYLHFTDLLINELVDGDADSTIIAHAGDELQIDCETETVYKNGVRFMTKLSLGSQWIDLQGGDSTALAFAPFDKCNFSVSYRPTEL